MIIVNLGLRTLLKHIRLTLVLSLAVGVPFMSFMLIQAYQAGLAARFSVSLTENLVVQTDGSFGEFYGSRLPASLGADLLAKGAGPLIPEIHTVIGTTQQDAVLLRGLPLEDLLRVEQIRIIAGRPLLPGDPARLTMIGMRLADTRGLLPGDNLSIRGRDFRVVGIFEAGTYAGNEAWVSLADAQTLLGWSSDVSVYLVPAGGVLKAGDVLPGGVSVVRQGDSSATLLHEWDRLFNLVYLVINALGAVAAISLASALWRLAWLQRHELAILRSLGFGKASLTIYLLCQAAAISLLGILEGELGALVIGAMNKIGSSGISIDASFDPRVLLASFAFALLITLVGSIIPVLWFNRLNLSTLLRSE